VRGEGCVLVGTRKENRGVGERLLYRRAAVSVQLVRELVSADSTPKGMSYTTDEMALGPDSLEDVVYLARGPYHLAKGRACR